MLEFFTDPWNMKVMHWTKYQLVSSLLQIGAGYLIISVISFSIILAVD